MINDNKNEYNRNYTEINECTSRGACSLSPEIAALEELSVFLLQQLAYYLLKLKDFGACNPQIKNEIIKVLASHISANEFGKNRLYKIIRNEEIMLREAKKTYKTLCDKKNISPQEPDTRYKFDSNTEISEAIATGERIYLDKLNNRSNLENNPINLIEIIIRSLSLNLSMLIDFGEFDDDIFNIILNMLNSLNEQNIKSDKIFETVENAANENAKLQINVAEHILKRFGGISKIRVSHSTEKGKAVLVSGNNLFDLLKILEKTNNTNIDVYTHSNLLIAHALNEFKRYPQLKGHYGSETENPLSDFATFPGAILLTKDSKNNPEYLYRGRLFSSDYTVPEGVVKIENDDFDKVIASAQAAKGFTKGKIKEDTPLGYDENESEETFGQIAEKLKNNEIKRLYIICTDTRTESRKYYFDEFIDNLNSDEFAISFSPVNENDNVFITNIANYSPLETYLLDKLLNKISPDKSESIFVFTDCNVMSISNIIRLKTQGVQNIFTVKCVPTQINPGTAEIFEKKYGIRNTTDAINDLDKIRE